MFNNKPRDKSGLEKAIDRLHEDMQTVEPYSEQYTQMTKNLSELYKLRDHDGRRWPVSPETLAVVAGNLIGIGMIVGHERAHVVTSKALSFITKLK